jgi:hypothetical protein
MGNMRNANKFLGGMTIYILEDNIKTDLREIVCEAGEWI